MPSGLRLADLEAKAAKADGYLATGELTVRAVEYEFAGHRPERAEGAVRLTSANLA